MGELLAEPLEPARLTAYLAGHGFTAEVRRARILTGGVSGTVVQVDLDGLRMVLKQPRSRLAVAADWRAPLSRAEIETRALRLAGRHTPGAVPDVIAWDAPRRVLIMESAADGSRPFKLDLMAGRVDPVVGAELGLLLGRWQRLGADHLDAWGPVQHENFASLRLDPYYRTAADRRPDLAPDLLALADETAAARDCLVHGDFSPKNVLVGRTTWVLDWEVAHLGDAAFDPAFLLSHLLLKCIARPQLAPEYAAVADAFLSAFVATGARPDWSRVHRHLGALLVARVLGKSPVDYLTADGQAAAGRLGAAMLRHPANTPPRLLDVLVSP